MPIVTSYATLGEEGLEMSLVQSHAKAIFVDPELITKLVKPLAKARELEWIIYNDQHEVNEDDIQKLETAHPHIKIIPLEQLVTLGKSNPCKPVPPQPEDLCCLMYTSGTTGAPKGVPLKHRNVVASSKYSLAVQPHSLLTSKSRGPRIHLHRLRRPSRFRTRISSTGTQFRIRIRERLSILGRENGVWKPPHAFRPLYEKQSRRHQRIPADDPSRRPCCLGNHPQRNRE